MLPIAEKIRNLRQQKNITQTDLADALGVSFQSVSRWERGQAYPDIEMIPKIAAYFGVTTDELLVANDDAKEQELENLAGEYFMQTYIEEDPHKLFEYRLETYRKFPKEHPKACEIAGDICRDLVIEGVLPRDEALPIVRELCLMLINQNTDSMHHNWALQNIYMYEDEDKLGEWQKYVGKQMTEPDLLELRYGYLDDYERLNYQRQQNLFAKINDMFPIHACKHFSDEEENARSVIESAEISLRLFDQFRDRDNDADIFINHRAWTYLFLAKGYFRLGKREEGYAAVEKALDLCEKLLKLPHDTVLHCPYPPFDLLSVKPFEKIGSLLPIAENTYHNFLSALTENDHQWCWFKPYISEARYQEILKRLEKLNPNQSQKPFSNEKLKELIKNGYITFKIPKK